MIKLTLIALLVFCSIILNGQENFTWDKTDSISKSKSEIYSNTKLFIAETWKSSKDVIHNDDKEAGDILVKGVSVKEVPHNMNTFTYVYRYTVRFRMRENRYKVTLDNVVCDKAYPVGLAKYDIREIEPFDGNYIKGKSSLSMSTLPEKKAIILMTSLKAELQSIIDSYVEHLNTESKSDDW